MTDKLYMVYLIKGHSPFFYLFTFLPFKKAIGFLTFRFSLFL